MIDTIGKLWRHGLTYAVGAAAGKAASFLLLPLYTRYLSLSQFGVLEMLSVTTDVAGVILGAGLSLAMIRYWKKYDDPAEKRAVVSTGLICSLLLAGGGMGLALLLKPWIAGAVLGGQHFAFALQLMFISTFFELSLALPMDLLRARERSGWYTGLSFSRTLANMALTIYLVAIQRMGVVGAMWANVAISAVASPILLVYTLRLIGGLRFSLPRLREMLAYGLPFIPTGLALFVLHSISRFFLRSRLGLDEVGLFAAGFKISVVLSALVSSPFAMVWSWLMFETEKQREGRRTIARVMTYYLVVSAFFALLLVALARDLLQVIRAAPAYWSAYEVVPLIVLGYIFYGAEWTASTGLCVKEKTIYRTYAVCGAAALNIGLNALLIPAFGLQGAAAAGTLSFFFMLLGTAWASHKVFPVAWEIKRGIHALLVAAVLAAAALATVRSFPGFWPGALLRGGIALSFPLCLALTGFLLPGEVEMLRGRRRRREDSGSRRPRALIVSHHFPPDLQVGASRPAHIAKYLPRLGWDTWVLTLPAEYYPQREDNCALDFLPEDRIVRVAPWRKAAPTASSLSGDGAGTGHLGPLRALKSWVAQSLGMRMHELLWVPAAIAAGKRIIRAEEIDVVFTSCSPFTGHLIGRALQRSTGRAWVADYHDPWSTNPWAGGRKAWQRGLRKWLEKTVVRHANYITIVNEGMREYFVEHAPYLDPARVLVVSHSFDPEELEASRSLAAPRDKRRMIVTYAGSLNAYRTPEALLQALSLAFDQGQLCPDEVEVRFIGATDLVNGRSLSDLLAEKELDGVVKVWGAVNHQQALAYLFASDLLLLLEPKSDGGEIFISYKVYEYLATGRPILAIAAESPRTSLLRTAGGTVVVSPDCPRDIAAALGECQQAWRQGRLRAERRPEIVDAFREPIPTRELAAIFARARDEIK